VPASRVEPKPVQRPRPPLTLGGYAKGVLRRAATLADGYNGGNIPLADMAGILRQLAVGQELADEEGVMRAEARPGRGEGRRLAEFAAGAIREDLGIGGAGDQGLDHGPARGSEETAGRPRRA